MSLLTYHKPIHDEIEKLIEDHVNTCRKSIYWEGEHRVVVKKIIDIFKRTH